MRKKTLLSITVLSTVLLFLLPATVWSQQGKIRGLVTDATTGDVLPGANVVIEGTTLGASADINGTFIILAVPPGVYTIRANFIGYQAEAVSNVRVSPNLTTTHDFALNQTAIQVDALQIVAERPLVQRNTTNTVRMTTQEDIRDLPIRGLQNIIALNAGTVQQDGLLHIRGGRSGEVAYFVDGATATNPLNNAENIGVIQEAIEEIQMQAGGYTAEYGGSNSGVVNTTVRTGGSRMAATLDYRTDDFAKGGGEFLGTTSQGYHNVVTTIGGPVPSFSKARFFIAGQYNYVRNRTSAFLEPFAFAGLTDDGLEGRAFGDSLPGTLAFERNFLPNNDRRAIDLNGTLSYDLSNSLKLRLTGSYGYTRRPEGWSSFNNALVNFFSNTESRTTTKRGLVSLRATHLLNAKTFYDVSLSWSTASNKNIDPRFGDDWLKYTDRNAWGAAGMDTSEWVGLYRGPNDFSIINNFTFTPTNEPKNSYSKSNQNSIGGALDFSTQFTKNFELKVGGRFDKWNMRNYSVGSIRNYLTFLHGLDGTSDQTFESDYVRRIELGQQGSVNYYGWDVDGLNKVNDGPNGPRKPLLISAYTQAKFEFRDLILNLGLRYEKYDVKAPRPANLEDPARDLANSWLDESAMIFSEPYDYLLPRLNFAFPVTDNTVFYAQYGEYVQLPSLSLIYKGGLRQWVRAVLPESRTLPGNEASFLAKPERTNQYELGIRQTITQDFAFTFTLFYKDLLDQIRGGQIRADGTGDLAAGTMIMGGLINDDLGTSKGVELTLELRRTKRLAAKINYTLSNTRGTGSDSRSTRVAISDVNFGIYPLFISNLDYNQPHRGSILLDYRFAQGDGGSIFQGLGINSLLTFSSGHSYTRVSEPGNLGQATPWNIGVRATQDPRQRHPVEPINSSFTPWNFNVDISVSKMLFFGSYNLRFYSNILNLFNTRNVINVYQTTGTDDDDGWLKSPLAVNFINTPGYLDFYDAVNLDNRWHYLGATGNDLWSRPRSIHFGVALELK